MYSCCIRYFNKHPPKKTHLIGISGKYIWCLPAGLAHGTQRRTLLPACSARGLVHENWASVLRLLQQLLGARVPACATPSGYCITSSPPHCLSARGPQL